jgi:hypothetical protein
MRDSRTHTNENLSFWLWCAKRFEVSKRRQALICTRISSRMHKRSEAWIETTYAETDNQR